MEKDPGAGPSSACRGSRSLDAVKANACGRRIPILALRVFGVGGRASRPVQARGGTAVGCRAQRGVRASVSRGAGRSLRLQLHPPTHPNPRTAGPGQMFRSLTAFGARPAALGAPRGAGRSGAGSAAALGARLLPPGAAAPRAPEPRWPPPPPSAE